MCQYESVIIDATVCKWRSIKVKSMSGAHIFPICVFFSVNFTFLGSILINLTALGKLSWHPLVGLWCLPLLSLFYKWSGFKPLQRHLCCHFSTSAPQRCMNLRPAKRWKTEGSTRWVSGQMYCGCNRVGLNLLLTRFSSPFCFLLSLVVSSQWLLQFLTMWTSLAPRVLAADQLHFLLYHYMSVYAHMPLFYSWFISLYSSISYSCRVYIKASAIFSL